MMSIQLKMCSMCKEEKEISKFSKHRNHKNGIRSNCKECDKIIRVKNKERIKLYNQKYRANNLENIKKNKQEYNKKNRIKINKSVRTNNKKRYYSDISYKMKKNIASRMNLALSNNTKSARTEILLGCSMEEFRMHLESKFLKGMSWANRSEWHIDHIRPCSSFDLSDPIQQKECFHYTNLQPLWAQDNLKKRDRLDWSNHE